MCCYDGTFAGSFKDGPWSYRIVSLIVMMPVYSALLVSFGTLAGKHAFFKKFAIRMWTRYEESMHTKNCTANDFSIKRLTASTTSTNKLDLRRMFFIKSK